MSFFTVTYRYVTPFILFDCDHFVSNVNVVSYFLIQILRWWCPTDIIRYTALKCIWKSTSLLSMQYFCLSSLDHSMCRTTLIIYHKFYGSNILLTAYICIYDVRFSALCFLFFNIPLFDKCLVYASWLRGKFNLQHLVKVSVHAQSQNSVIYELSRVLPHK